MGKEKILLDILRSGNLSSLSLRAINEDVRLVLSDGIKTREIVLNEGEALVVAHWILDNYGDPKRWNDRIDAMAAKGMTPKEIADFILKLKDEKELQRKKK